VCLALKIVDKAYPIVDIYIFHIQHFSFWYLFVTILLFLYANPKVNEADGYLPKCLIFVKTRLT
jgi:hypothetical protein